MPLRWFTTSLEHLGANILFYLVTADLFLAGIYRGTQAVEQFPLWGTSDAAWCAAGILIMGRFIHYLAASSRK